MNVLPEFSGGSKIQVGLFRTKFALLESANSGLRHGANFSEIYGAVLEIWANRVECETTVLCIMTSHNEVSVA